jgi:hypothetical protein
MTSDEELAAGRVFPSVTAIRDVSTAVATAVAHHAYEKKIARINPGRGESIEAFVQRKMYFPEYVRRAARGRSPHAALLTCRSHHMPRSPQAARARSARLKADSLT